MTDREVAERAARAAGAAALARFGGTLDVAFKSSPADPVTAADHEAEAAAVPVLRAERPDDGVVGEEHARADGARTWVVDALDGTANFVAGVPHWCSAVALTAAGGAPLVAAVADPVRGEVHAAARGEGPGAAALRVRRTRPLAHALVATFLRPDKVEPGRGGELTARLLAAAGGLRTTGSGTLDLAWVAAGRLDAWVQPDPDPWDWLPGALLVEAAGGTTAVVGDRPAWHLAGVPAVVEELAAVIARPA